MCPMFHSEALAAAEAEASDRAAVTCSLGFRICLQFISLAHLFICFICSSFALFGFCLLLVSLKLRKMIQLICSEYDELDM